MRLCRDRVALVLALVLAALAVAAPGSAQHPHARFVAAIEQAKAHLLLCRELYAVGQASEAVLHASHPVQEIGGWIYGRVSRALDAVPAAS